MRWICISVISIALISIYSWTVAAMKPKQHGQGQPHPFGHDGVDIDSRVFMSLRMSRKDISFCCCRCGNGISNVKDDSVSVTTESAAQSDLDSTDSDAFRWYLIPSENIDCNDMLCVNKLPDQCQNHGNQLEWSGRTGMLDVWQNNLVDVKNGKNDTVTRQTRQGIIDVCKYKRGVSATYFDKLNEMLTSVN